MGPHRLEGYAIVSRGKCVSCVVRGQWEGVWETSVLRGFGRGGRWLKWVEQGRRAVDGAAAGAGEPVKKGCLLKPYQGV